MSSEKTKKNKKKFGLDLKAVGMRLREVREFFGLSLEKMSEVSGFSKSMISEAEHGLKKPSAIYLHALLEHFNVNINYILNGKGRMFLPRLTTLTQDSSTESPDMNSDAKKFEGLLSEMLYLVEHVDMVKYAMLSYFISYKTQNLPVIKKLLEQITAEEML